MKSQCKPDLTSLAFKTYIRASSAYWRQCFENLNSKLAHAKLAECTIEHTHISRSGVIPETRRQNRSYINWLCSTPVGAPVHDELAQSLQCCNLQPHQVRFAGGSACCSCQAGPRQAYAGQQQMHQQLQLWRKLQGALQR